MDDRIHHHAISLIVRLLYDRTGQTLSEDRRYRIDRAIETVLTKRGIAHSSDLLALLTQPDSAAIEEELIEALINNETYFFRDRQVFDQLAQRILPELAKARIPNRELAIWSAGCSTGQEPLSLAMTFLDQGSVWHRWRIRIDATDVSHSAISAARLATYSQFEIQRGLAVGQMLDHFDETPSGWRAKNRLAGMVRYHTGNLLNGPPAGGPFDLILCRNVLLYFDPIAQQKAWSCLAQALSPHGLLVLGGGETVLGRTRLFELAGFDGAIFRGAPSRTVAA